MGLLAFFAPVLSTSAGIVATYDDKSDFMSDTGAVSLTGPIPNDGNVGTSETIGDITLSAGNSIFFGASGTSFSEWSTLIPGNDIAISGPENLDIAINLASPLFTFGFDFHEPTDDGAPPDGCNTAGEACVDSIFTITFLNGAATVDSTTFNAADDELVFLGWALDMAFDGVEIEEADAANDKDNEYFGQFYGGTRPIPAPATLLLLGLGLVALALPLRRR